MKQKELSLVTNRLLASFILVILTFAGPAWAASTKYQVLYRFQSGSDGGGPNGNLVLDSSGNLYGATFKGGNLQCAGDGGISGCGTVFELSPPTLGGAWTRTTLYAFSGGIDGATPYDGLILDQAGNLYGTTAIGGTGQCKNSYGTVIGCGTVFEIAPTGSTGGGWTEKILYSFQGQDSNGDGAYPFAGVVADETGNLFGTTLGGGNSLGIIFELAPPGSRGGPWTETVLYTAGQSSPKGLYARVILDRAGNLYTTSAFGGTDYAGTVFKLSQPDWTPTIVYSFNFKHGGNTPTTGVIFDNKGNLYGTTIYGGVDNPVCGGLGCGTAFRLTAPSRQGGRWTEAVIHAFQGVPDGFTPGGCVILDQAGNIYGTTSYGGLNVHDGYGTVFRLTSQNKNGAFAKTILHRFADHPAEYPGGNLVFGPSGEIYGATALGDSSAPGGTIFKLTVD